jgi:hypothetical protein
MVLIEDSIWGFTPQYILDTKTLALEDKHDIFFLWIVIPLFLFW